MFSQTIIATTECEKIYILRGREVYIPKPSNEKCLESIQYMLYTTIVDKSKLLN